MLDFDRETVTRLHALYDTPAIEARRRFVRDSLDLEAGEDVLDIGVGTGYEPAELADVVGPEGTVHGVDASAAMLAAAREYCAGRPNVTFARGSADDLPVAAGSVDAGVSVQVYEYVPDLDAALAELYRALRPGGRAAVFGTDWDSIVWRASDPDRMARVLDAYEDHCAHPDFGRKVGPRLERAGFAVDPPESFTLLDRGLGEDAFSEGHIDLVGEYVADHDAIGPAEADAWAEDLRALDDRGEYFYSLTGYLFVARKPAGTPASDET